MDQQHSRPRPRVATAPLDEQIITSAAPAPALEELDWSDDPESTEPSEASPSETASEDSPCSQHQPLTIGRRISIFVLVFGLLVLAGGLGFFLYKYLTPSVVADASYLVEVGAWQRVDAPSVIWDFTSVGEGSLTTNDHLNDYHFLWAIDGDQLQLDTDWLYTLNDAFTYRLDQSADQLILERDGEAVTFVPAAE